MDKNLWNAVLAFVLLLTCTGCLCVAKGQIIPDHHPTLGEELEDLHETYEDGIISAGEYERAKAMILKRYEEEIKSST